jgi:hypothetical protein
VKLVRAIRECLKRPANLRLLLMSSWRRNLRRYGDRSELSEMFVECKCFRDAESHHHNIAHTVGETPGFVLVGLKDQPGLKHVGGLHPFQTGGQSPKESFAEYDCALKFAACLEQRQ